MILSAASHLFFFFIGSQNRFHLLINTSSYPNNREVCWVLFNLSYIPAKCLKWLRSGYLPIEMTPLYWQLFASQQTDLLLPPLLINRNLARIQEWCNHRCMILNPNKPKALVAGRSRTVSPPHSDLVLSGLSIRASPNLDIPGTKSDSKLTLEENVRGIVSRVSQRIGILRLVR